MSSRALLVIAALAACHGRPAPPRQRVLERIPADARVVVAADGAVLAAPRMRAVVDVLRPRWPARFGCVIDAALAGDHAALGIGAQGDLVVVIATRAAVTCPALSRLADSVWAATLGAARPAAPGAPSVLDDAAHARARPSLLQAPLAAEVLLPGARVIATAGIDPLEGWLAIDVPEEASALAEQKVRGVVDKLARTNATVALADRIAVSHDGPQVIARLAGPVEVDLASAVRAALAILEAPEDRPRAALVCPVLAPPIVACANGSRLTATSLSAALVPLAAARLTPIVVNERVASLRLEAPVPSLGLRAGDHVLAIDGRHVTSTAQLGELLAGARARAVITLQRDAEAASLEVIEQRF
ncbi:MAG: hypothetical protein JNL83_22850 [Myxococcales bacterium]|nr:hypothetical protein [Myxococcales bacterium]